MQNKDCKLRWAERKRCLRCCAHILSKRKIATKKCYPRVPRISRGFRKNGCEMSPKLASHVTSSTRRDVLEKIFFQHVTAAANSNICTLCSQKICVFANNLHTFLCGSTKECKAQSKKKHGNIC